jgi:murein DD-endopeptidase MepM/ murein hydrolase activator NlpD
MLKIEQTPGTEIRICYNNGKYEAKIIKIKTFSIKTVVEGTIENSFYSDTVKAGIPDGAVMQMFDLLSFDVDFQRDIYGGEKFNILFENIINSDGEIISKGDIIFLNLSLSKKDLKIYRFTCDDGQTDYFNENGINTRKTLLKTPIHGARISSGYGRRIHPLAGYSHIHRAIDFAAPQNTPIIASGSGTVEIADWYGTYGRCVIIRHANQYNTLYAPMNRFANGIRKGQYVRQGEIIGYVGRTGVATGNHLHYEVIFRGTKINPSTVKAPPEKKLSTEEFNRFMKEVKKIDTEYKIVSSKATAF